MGPGYIKYILFIVNLFFAVASLGSIGMNVDIHLKVTVVQGLGFNMAPDCSIVLCCAVFGKAFLGCCGAVRENFCLLIAYAICNSVLILMKVTLTSLIFSSLGKLMIRASELLFETYHKDPHAFHEIEMAFHCCGPTGAASYPARQTLPESCCPGQGYCVPMYAYQGCDDILKRYLKTTGFTICGTNLLIAFFELIAVIFSLILASSVARERAQRTVPGVPSDSMLPEIQSA